MHADSGDQEKTRYEAAKSRVEDLKGFYIHLIWYVLVNTGLFLLNFFTSPGEWWFVFPLLGWGVGIIAHAASVFMTVGLFSREWEERKISEILERENKES